MVIATWLWMEFSMPLGNKINHNFLRADQKPTRST
jgi:hypothetical protein